MAASAIRNKARSRRRSVVDIYVSLLLRYILQPLPNQPLLGSS